MKLKIAVLFDGAGLARLGLERAGHDCTGIELDPWKHELSKHIGSGNCLYGDVRDFDLSLFDAVWASPPCQLHSVARTQGPVKSSFGEDLLEWSLKLPHEVLWVENVVSPSTRHLGVHWNAAQFRQVPIQNRNRIVGGRYVNPIVYRSYKRAVPGICPCISASENRGCASDTRRASRFYGRKLTLDECAYHQGLTIPAAWRTPPAHWRESVAAWRNNVYQGIGNGVPVYMAEKFGEAYDIPFEEVDD